jgi:O-antigen ligase
MNRLLSQTTPVIGQAPMALQARARRGFMGAFAGVINGPWVFGAATGAIISLFSLMDFLFRPVIVGRAGFDEMRVASPTLAFALTLVALASCAPMIIAGCVFGVDFRRVKSLSVVSLFICLSIPISFLTVTDASAFRYIPLVYFIFASLVFGAAANMDPEAFLRGFGLGLILVQVAIFIAVMIDHDVQWGRLFGRNSANYWGMAAQCVVIGCVVVRGRLLQIATLALCGVIIVWTQSRGSMIALGLALPVGFALYAITSRRRIWSSLILSACLVVGIIFGLEFFADQILLLSDHARGLGSGFTGRTSAWLETFNLFTAHPLFGVGYRQHEQYLTSAASAHNAYLATLADTGIVGFLGYLALVFGALAKSVLKVFSNPSAGRIMIATFLTAYAANGIFERSALNIGNTYSMMMIVLCAWAWRDDAETRRYWPTPQPWRRPRWR